MHFYEESDIMSDRPPSYEEACSLLSNGGVLEISPDNFNNLEDHHHEFACHQPDCNVREILLNNNNNVVRHSKNHPSHCISKDDHHARRHNRSRRHPRIRRRQVVMEDIPHVGTKLAKSKIIEHKKSQRHILPSCSARDIEITRIDHYSCMDYHIQTMYQKIESVNATRPARTVTERGLSRRGSGHSDVVVYKPEKYFEDGRHSFNVPQTSTVSTCDKCNGTCNVKCERCSGEGYHICWTCNGNPRLPCDFTSDTKAQGIHNSQECSPCNGYGRISCTHCESGKSKCDKCDGCGKVESFERQTIIWKNKTDYLQNIDFGIPPEEIQQHKAKFIFQQEAKLVDDIGLAQCIEPNICNNANNLIHRHKSSRNETCTILRQRHCVRLIPVTKVLYTKKNKEKKIFFLGYEQKVYKPDKYFKCFPLCCCVTM